MTDIYTNSQTLYSVYLSGQYLAHYATEEVAKEHARELYDKGFCVAGSYTKHEPGTLYLVGNRVQADPYQEDDSWDFHISEVEWLPWEEYYPEEYDPE